MNAKTKWNSKPGTIGRSIEKLVRKCKANPIQFYILESALREACETPSALIKLDGKLVSETEGYKKQRAEQEAIFKACGF